MLSQPQSQDLGSEIYSGAASFGLIYSLIGAIIGTIIGLVMIISGIYMLFKKISTVSVNAKILSINCYLGQNNTQTCNINVSYNYNNKEESGFVTSSGNLVYSPNQKISIFINKDNPNELYLQEPSPKTFGFILLFLGIFIIIAGWFWFWLSRKYKFLAAAEGVSGVFNLFRR